MSLEVVGAGFGRTGTLSMKLALELLGLGPCHHMFEVFGRPGDAEGWARAIEGDEVDLDALLVGFRSTLDFPACLLWEALFAANPDARVLLTVRPADEWWRSFESTIGPNIHPATPHDDAGFAALTTAIDRVAFSGRADDRATAVGAYERHNARVMAHVPADRLLVYQVGAGWEPLCEFLGVDVPDEPFPHTNTSDEWAKNHPT
jgi:hypothetical protein